MQLLPTSHGKYHVLIDNNAVYSVWIDYRCNNRFHIYHGDRVLIHRENLAELSEKTDVAYKLILVSGMFKKSPAHLHIMKNLIVKFD